MAPRVDAEAVMYQLGGVVSEGHSGVVQIWPWRQRRGQGSTWEVRGKYVGSTWEVRGHYVPCSTQWTYAGGCRSLFPSARLLSCSFGPEGD